MLQKEKKEVKAAFKVILKKEKEMKANDGTDLYWIKQEELKDLLLEFVKVDFSILSKMEIFKLCQLVCSHRPMALHSFLGHFSNFLKVS